MNCRAAEDYCNDELFIDLYEAAINPHDMSKRCLDVNHCYPEEET
jgi:hypothetical protein